MYKPKVRIHSFIHSQDIAPTKVQSKDKRQLQPTYCKSCQLNANICDLKLYSVYVNNFIGTYPAFLLLGLVVILQHLVAVSIIHPSLTICALSKEFYGIFVPLFAENFR